MYPFVGFTVFYGPKETAHNQSTLSKTDPTDNQAALNISYIYPSSLKKGRMKKRTRPVHSTKAVDQTAKTCIRFPFRLFSWK